MFADIYVVIYATVDGQTGHAALAIDDYDIIVKDTIIDGQKEYITDTVTNGGIIYFDLSAADGNIKFSNMNKEHEPLYHKYPENGKRLTIKELYFEGLPTKKVERRFDGLIRIKSDQLTDYQLTNYMNHLIDKKQPYHLFKYNCTDFVIDALELIYDEKIRAKEFFLINNSNTPNKLFRKLQRLGKTKVLLDPKDKVKGSFFCQRILKKEKTKIE